VFTISEALYLDSLSKPVQHLSRIHGSNSIHLYGKQLLSIVCNIFVQLLY
jgi:hypothetical protein